MCDEVWQAMKTRRRRMVPIFFHEANCRGESTEDYEMNAGHRLSRNIRSYILPETFKVEFFLAERGARVVHSNIDRRAIVQDTSRETVLWQPGNARQPLDAAEYMKVVPPSFDYWQLLEAACTEYNRVPTEYFMWDSCQQVAAGAADPTGSANRTAIADQTMNSSSSTTYSQPDWFFWVMFGLMLGGLLIIFFAYWYLRSKPVVVVAPASIRQYDTFVTAPPDTV